MRFLIVSTPYPSFLKDLYVQNSGLEDLPYDHQLNTIMDQSFAIADSYSSNLRKLGQEAIDVIPNCEPLQRQWARENDLDLENINNIFSGLRMILPTKFQSTQVDRYYKILFNQIKRFRPDVLYILPVVRTNPNFLKEVRPYAKLIVGQIASGYPPDYDFRNYDLILSSFPHFVERFRSNGLKSEYFRLGFRDQVLSKIQKRELRYEVVFVGGLAPIFSQRIHLLESITKICPIDIWGNGANTLNSNSPIHDTYRGTAWAMDMYNIINNAKIVLNHHVDAAENYANNMRLYETTGIGALLLTDHKENLKELFEPGKELLEYHSNGECVEIIEHYLKKDDLRKTIATQGQARTLSEHTYFHRMQELMEIIKKQIYFEITTRKSIG